MTAPSPYFSPWQVTPIPFPSQISTVNAGHAPTDFSVQSGDKSTVPHSNSATLTPPGETECPTLLPLPASGSPIINQDQRS